MKKTLFNLNIFVISISILTSQALQAAETDSKSSERSSDNSFLTLGDMTVTESEKGPLKSQDMLTSVDILGPNLIEHENVGYSWELFRKLPGLTITNFNQGNVSGEFAMRGFNGEGGINAVKLLIDGIPSNSNSGNMEFLDSVFPLDIDSIEVVRGTNDARYGLHNIAGNANIKTRRGGDYAKARISYGSFDTFDAQFSGGIETNGFSQNYFGNFRDSSGNKDHSDSEKFSVGGKWFFTPENEKFNVGLIARWYESDTESPGYLSFAESRNNPTLSLPFNNTDGHKRELGQISGHLDIELTENLSYSLKSYTNIIDDRRLVRFVDFRGQQERITDELQYGVINTMTYRPEISFLDDFVLEGGFDFQQQENESIRYATTQRVRTAQTRSQDFDFAIYGGFVQAVIKPVSWLKLVPAVRIDTADGEFTNELTGQTLDLNNYDAIWQPKFSAVITPIDGYSLYGNWGRTFQVGVGAGAYKNRPGAEGVDPSINEGWEIGVKFSPVDWMQGRVAYWEQSASDEVQRKLLDPFGDSTNIGETERRGADVQVNIQPIDQLEIWAAYSWQEGIIETPGATQGNEINHIPDYVFSGGIDYQITPELGSSLTAYSQGNYFISTNNNASRQFGEYYLLNLSLDYKVTEQIGLEFQVTNLTDEHWEYVWEWSLTVPTLHSPGNERAFYGAITYEF